MLKKITPLLLALALALSLVACGGKSTPADNDNTPAQSTESGQSTDAAQTPATEQTDDAQDTENTESKFQRGKVDGNTYRSDFLGMQVTLDENWIIADDEQLVLLGGLVTDSFEDEDVRKLLDSGSTIYEFYALQQTDNSSVNITVQELGLLGGIMMNEDAYADMNLQSLPDMLSSSGITLTQTEKTTMEFAGGTHTALTLEGTVNDVPLYETIVLVKSGNYMAVITAATFDETNPPADLLALFQGL